MSLSVKKQLSILNISTLIIAVVVSATLTILVITRQGRAASEEYRAQEMNTVRTNVKDYVEMAYQSIESSYRSIEDKAYLEKFYGHRLQSIMDIAIAAIEKKAQAVQDRKLSLKEAQQQAIRDIEAMRFDNRTGYIWVNDTTLPYPKMIMHPTVPALNGTFLTDPKFDCAMGRNQNLFQAGTEVALANGRGFINYIWPKPTPNGEPKLVKKLSFVYLYEPWGWVLGTGIYLDDARDDVINSILENLKTLKYNDGQGYFWINDMQLPYPTMVMHPTVPSLNGKILNDTAFNCVKGTGQNFFQVMVQTAQKDGGGYVEYIWPNPVTGKRESKLSYVKKFEPLNWVVGTGAFIDHIEAKIKAKEAEITSRVQKIVIVTLAIGLVLIVVGYWATASVGNSITRAITVVKDSLQSLSVGKTIDKLKVKGNNEISIMNSSLNNLVDGINSYSTFASEIGNGNLDVDFKALSEEDALGNSLVQMRNNLKKINKEEAERKWHAEGMSFFNDLIRKYDDSLQKLSDQVASEVARYMDANQSALYLLEQDEENNSYLTLYACYAYKRKKHQEEKIPVGNGLIGQVVLEKNYIYLTEVPSDYTKITSGLGEATPRAIIILPLLYNEEVQGVLEIASFHQFKPYEVEFLKKLAENIAASLSTSRTNERTRLLLEQTRQLSEEMKAQEEELRQNNEELQATQEEMARKLSSMEKKGEY